MKKILLLMCCMIFLIVNVSALEVDNIKGYDKAEEKITIYNYNFIGKLFDIKLAEYTLTENTDQCLINCHAEGTATLYSKGKLFSDLRFKNKRSNFVNIKSSKILIEVEETYQIEITDYTKSCSNVININGTNKECSDIQTGSHNETKTKIYWKEYNNSVLSSGNYKWRIEGKKKPNEDVDWIGSAFGEDFNEWAWWNADYTNKMFVNLTDPLVVEVSRNEYVEVEFNGITIQTNCTAEFHLLNSAEDTEIPRDIVSGNATACKVGFIVNKSSAENSKLFYGYFNNPTPTPPSYTGNFTLTGENTVSCDLTSTRYNLTLEENAVLSANKFSVSDVAPNFGTYTNDWGNLIFANVNPAVENCTVVFDGEIKKKILYGAGSGNHVNISFYDGLDYWLFETSGYNTNAGQFIRSDKGTGAKRLHYRNSSFGYNRLTSEQSATGFTSFGFISTGLATADTVKQFIMSNDTSQTQRGAVTFMRTANTEDPLITVHGVGHVTFSGNLDSLTSHYSGIISDNDTEREDMYMGRTNPLVFVFGSIELNEVVVTTLISPIDFFNSSSSTIEFIFNSTPFGINLTNTTLFIWFNNSSLFTSNFNSLSGNTTVTNNVTILNIPDGNFIWNALTKGTPNTFDWDINRTFEVDITSPNINVTFPRGIINFHVVGNNLTLNWSVTDTNLDSCWFDYNNTNTTLTCGDNNFSFISTTQKNLTFYANDTFNNLGSNFTSWDYKILEINQTFNNQTTEGSLETFLATILLGNGSSINSVNFYYNNSVSIGQSFISGNNIILRKLNFLIPNVEAETNNSFIWEITLSDSTTLNLTIQNQTVFNLGLDNCSSFSNKLLNLTVVDEELQTILPNATIEIAVNIFSEDRTTIIVNFSNIFQSVNPLSICLNQNISESVRYSLDSTIRYVDEIHANEYYNIVNFTLTNDTATQNIILFDLNLSDSTEFQLSFTGSDFLPVENALINVDRQYISENLFKTVELPKTDFNGQTILHLVRNDVIYNIRIIKDGIILGNFENLVAFCDDFTIGDCNIELNAFDSVENIFEYNEDLGIIFNAPTFNSTLSQVTFNFLTSDGSAKEVLLEVTRNDIFGNRSICNSSIISSGGTLICSINPNLDDSNLNIKIFTDGILTVNGNVDLDTTNFGAGGYLIMFFMAMTFALLFSGSKTGVLFSIGLTFAGSIGLGLRSGNLTGLGASGLWLLIILFVGIYKLNSERQP